MQILRYDELTWPQVAALPRHLPLLIPLGLDDYDIPSAIRRLKADAVVLLPAIPYGLPRPKVGLLGQLAVSPRLRRRLLRAVQRGLLEQAFEHVVFLADRELVRSLADERLRLLATRSLAPSFPPMPTGLAGKIIVVSLGHTEQHGHHLPLGTDTFIIQALADGLAAAAPDEVVCLPAWPYGVSTHTREFPGTLDIGGRLFEDFFLAIVARLAALGAQMVYFSNAHGGNHSFLVNVVKWAGERWAAMFVATEWLHTTGPALERLRQSQLGGMGHGGELETSYLLHLRPDLVQMDKARIETDFISTPNFYMDWIEGGRLIANPPWGDDTRSGIYGDATLATADRGRRWLEAAVEERLESLREIRQQYERRMAHRRARAHRDVAGRSR
ncbi:MAG: creatininase family protein [Chloroflexota bacterium]